MLLCSHICPQVQLLASMNIAAVQSVLLFSFSALVKLVLMLWILCWTLVCAPQGMLPRWASLCGTSLTGAGLASRLIQTELAVMLMSIALLCRTPYVSGMAYQPTMHTEPLMIPSFCSRFCLVCFKTVANLVWLS